MRTTMIDSRTAVEVVCRIEVKMLLLNVLLMLARFSRSSDHVSFDIING